MARVLFNGRDCSDDARLREARTWSEALDRLDELSGETGDIVSAVRFDGVDDPAFRDASRLGRPLDRGQVIEADSGSPEALIATCVNEARMALPMLAQAALRVGDGFRGHEIDEANRGLVELSEALGMLLSIVGAVSTALHIDLAGVHGDGRTASDLIDELTSHVEAVMASERAGDWMTVADILQYDIEPAIRRWAPALDALVTVQARAS